MRSRPLVAPVLFACTLLAAGPAIAAPAQPPGATAPPPSEPNAPALQSLPTPAVSALPDQCDRPGGKQKFRITLKQEAELGDLVEWMMSVSCQKFIWDPKLRTKTVNIVAPEPVTMQEAYAAFHAALATIGATVEPAGDFYRIVETSQVASAGFRVYGPGADVPADGRIVTKVWRPAAEMQAQTASLLTELKTDSGVVRTVGDVVIVTDTGARIRTLERLLADLEQPQGPHRKVHLYGVRHADAEALSEVVRSVFDAGLGNIAAPSSSTTTTSVKPAAKKGKNGNKQRAAAKTAAPSTAAPADDTPSITLDARTGTLLVVCTDATFAAVSRLLDELDIDGGEGRETLHVIELAHVDAEEVAGVLSNLASGTQPSSDRGKAAVAGASISGAVKVTAHAATQTLIVNSTALDFAALQKVIRRIDHPRQQLYLEVYLLEVRTELGRDVDVGAHFGQNAAGGIGYASSKPGSASAISPGVLDGLAAGLIGPTLPTTLFGFDADIPAFGVTLQALETQEDIDIVAQPHLYAAENEQAVAEFGETIPFRSGTTTTSNPIAPTIDNIQNQDVTLKLEITPYINDNETISLDILLEDRQLGALDAGTGNYRTLKRKLDLKKVVAHPGQPLVLGGLTREVEAISDSRVPGLGSIPVLGWLFRKRNRRKEKISLLMVMVPHIIESPDDARRIHSRRTRERQEFIDRYTAFKRRDLGSHINYKKTSGLLSAVTVAAERQERDGEHAAAAEAELLRPRISTTIDPQAPDPAG